MKKIIIERTTTQGYESKEWELDEAIDILNLELDNKKMIFIDGKPFDKDIITQENILTCKKEISVTNRLVGG